MGRIKKSVKMKMLILGLLALVNADCASDNTWGEGTFECKLPCGNCQGGALCDGATGACPSECETGWAGNNCDEAVCDAEACGWYGQCVAPDICRCPKKHTRLFTYDSNGDITKIECEHQAWSGFVYGFIPTIIILCLVLILLNFLHQRKLVTMCVEKED